MSFWAYKSDFCMVLGGSIGFNRSTRLDVESIWDWANIELLIPREEFSLETQGRVM